MTTTERAQDRAHALSGTHEHPRPMNTPAAGGEPTVDYETLADQVEALADSMDCISETGRAFLAGAETALRATAEVME